LIEKLIVLSDLTETKFVFSISADADTLPRELLDITTVL